MTGADDRLAQLRQQLGELEEAPLSAHPEVLEQTHRELVEELERLEHVDEAPGGGGEPPHEDGGPAN